VTVAAANYLFSLVAGAYAIDWKVIGTPGTGTPIFFALVNATSATTYTTLPGLNYAAGNTAAAVSQQLPASVLLIVPVDGMSVALVNETGVSVLSGAGPAPMPDTSATPVDASIRFLRLG
jgi:hypothetical protein